MAQLVARFLDMEKVPGSSPGAITIFSLRPLWRDSISDKKIQFLRMAHCELPVDVLN
jgi:hypothetical protein